MQGFVRVTPSGQERSTSPRRRRKPPARIRLLEALDEQIGAIIMVDRGKLLQSSAGRELVGLLPVMLCDCYHTDLRVRPLLPRLRVLTDQSLPHEAVDAIVGLEKLLPPGKKARKRLLRRANPKTMR